MTNYFLPPDSNDYHLSMAAQTHFATEDMYAGIVGRETGDLLTSSGLESVLQAQPLIAVRRSNRQFLNTGTFDDRY